MTRMTTRPNLATALATILALPAALMAADMKMAHKMGHDPEMVIKHHGQTVGSTLVLFVPDPMHPQAKEKTTFAISFMDAKSREAVAAEQDAPPATEVAPEEALTQAPRAQAQALRDASSSGAPFCEACEKARQ